MIGRQFGEAVGDMLGRLEGNGFGGMVGTRDVGNRVGLKVRLKV